MRGPFDVGKCGHGINGFGCGRIRFARNAPRAPGTRRTRGVCRCSSDSHPGVDEFDDGGPEIFRMGQVLRRSPQTPVCRRRRMQSAAFWRGLAIRFMRALFRYMWWETCWVGQCVWPGVNCGPTSKRNANAVVHKKLLNGFNGSLHNWNDIHREKRACRSVRTKPIATGSRECGIGFPAGDFLRTLAG